MNLLMGSVDFYYFFSLNFVGLADCLICRGCSPRGGEKDRACRIVPTAAGPPLPVKKHMHAQLSAVCMCIGVSG